MHFCASWTDLSKALDCFPHDIIVKIMHIVSTKMS